MGTVAQGGQTASAKMELKDSTGRLIYMEKVPYPNFLAPFHKWRCTWCMTNRTAWCPWGFREGKVNPLTYGFYLLKKLKGGKSDG